ncbi:DUF4112 domain-containing protein [Oceaniglobus indicus]|uniref:DUF4112 domain-containing protein n=1 Tax=Oceaniglobus indicus TaxID=2047749 RepID=UPI000C1804CB|nr:DUF4112 domain-containing protein [Oceaniglobus indicus]
MSRHAAELRRIDRLARLLDARFSVLGIRFGYDSLIGLIPGVGDAVVAVPAAWLIWRAHRLGVPRTVLVRMMVNWGIDLGVGAVPVVGDLFDVAFKGNLRNARLLQEVLKKQAAETAG